MKPDSTVLRQTGWVAAGIFIMAGIMIAVYAVIGKFTAGVVWGGLYTNLLTVLNFFTLGLTVQGIAAKAAEKERSEEEMEALTRQMDAKMKLSRNARTIALLVLIVIGIRVFHFPALPTILPIVFPAVVVRVVQIIEIKKSNASKGSEQP